jgi:phosphohistidine phosphatase SixA
MKRLLFAIALLFPLTLAAADGVTTVILVRHAEAMQDSQDPGLTEAGTARAKALAVLARDAQVSAVLTSQYKRTKDTAAELKVPVVETQVERGKIADHASAVAKRITAEYAGKTVVVVGHSNTVPEIVKALSGAAVTEIAHEEYSRVYVVVLEAGKPARVVVARYGA